MIFKSIVLGRSAFKIVRNKPAGKRPLGVDGRTIRMDLKEICINTRN